MTAESKSYGSWDLIYSNFYMSVRIIPFFKGVEFLWVIVQVNFSTADLFMQYQLVVVLNLQEVNNCWSSITKKKNCCLVLLHIVNTIYCLLKNFHFSMFRIAFLM